MLDPASPEGQFVQNIGTQIVLSLADKGYTFLLRTLKRKVTKEQTTSDEYARLSSSALDDEDAKAVLKRLANTLVRSLEKRFEESDLGDDDLTPIKLYLETVLDRLSFDASVMQDYRHDPDAVANYLGSLIIEGELQAFNEEQRLLIQEVLRSLGEPLVKLSFELPSSVSLLLTRSDKLLQGVQEVLAELTQIKAAVLKNSGSTEFVDYEDTYRIRVAEHYNRMELLGLDNITPKLQRYPLETSFVHLRLETGSQASLSIAQAVAEHQKLLLKGTAGSGKTTLLRWFTVMAARGELIRYPRLAGKLPILMTLRDYDDKPLPLKLSDMLPEFPIMPFISRDHLEMSLQERFKVGKVLMVIDGFDEVNSEEKVRSWINTLVTQYPNVTYVISSRPIDRLEARVGIPGLGLRVAKFQTAQVEEMNGRELEELVMRWYDVAAKEAGESRGQAPARALLERIMVNPVLRGIASTPLLASAICALDYHSTGGIPVKLHLLYDALIQMMVERRDQARHVRKTIPLDLSAKTYLLAALAGYMARKHTTRVSREEILEVLKDVLPSVGGKVDIDKVYLHLVDRTGLIRQVSESRFEFVHKTFLEYLAAHSFSLEGRDDYAAQYFLEDQRNQAGELSYFIAVRSQKPWMVLGDMMQVLIDNQDRVSEFDLLLALQTLGRIVEDCTFIEVNAGVQLASTYREIKTFYKYSLSSEEWEGIEQKLAHKLPLNLVQENQKRSQLKNRHKKK